MRATIVLTVEFDPDHVADRARHRDCAAADILKEMAGFLEIRTADAVRYLDGVQPPIRVATTVDTEV
jgi:hypothetical protein